MYERQRYPFNVITPLTVIWHPHTLPLLPTEDARPKGKKIIDHSAGSPNPSGIRFVWLRFHPSVESTVLETLKAAASHALSRYNESQEHLTEVSLEIVNLQGQFNVFEIMGPKSSQVLHGAFSPVNSENRSDFLQVKTTSHHQNDMI